MAPEAPPKAHGPPAPRAPTWPRQGPQVPELGMQNWDEMTAPAGTSFRKLPQARVPGDSVCVTTSLQDLLWCCMMQSLPQSRLDSCPDKLEDKSCAGVHSPLCSPEIAILWGARSTQGQVMCRCQSSLCLLNRSSSGLSLQSRGCLKRICFTHRDVSSPFAEPAELWWLLSSRNKVPPGFWHQ